MPPQVWTFYLYLLLAVVVTAVFLWTALSTRRPEEITLAAANRLRWRLFFLITAVLVLALAMTLTRMPYELHAQEIPDRVVFVAGKQFAFAVSETPVVSEEEWEANTTTGAPVVVPSGSLVEIRVSSLDVNHSMGIYDPDDVLVGQVQGMPGYVNRLRLRFDRPGRYNILCLELCGNLHSRMRGVIQVADAPRGATP